MECRSCNWIRDRLCALIEGEVVGRDREDIEEHLRSCAECADEYESLQRTFELLRDDGYREPSPFYWTRFNARLRRRLREETGVSAAQRLVPRLVPVAVGIAFFAVGLSLGLRPGAQVAPSAGQQFASRSAAESDGSIISARSKLLVETGADRGSYAFAADTLKPDGFDPMTEEPRVYLAASESAAPEWAEMERLLRERLMRE